LKNVWQNSSSMLFKIHIKGKISLIPFLFHLLFLFLFFFRSFSFLLIASLSRHFSSSPASPATSSPILSTQPAASGSCPSTPWPPPPRGFCSQPQAGRLWLVPLQPPPADHLLPTNRAPVGPTPGLGWQRSWRSRRSQTKPGFPGAASPNPLP